MKPGGTWNFCIAGTFGRNADENGSGREKEITEIVKQELPEYLSLESTTCLQFPRDFVHLGVLEENKAFRNLHILMVSDESSVQARRLFLAHLSQR